MPTDSQRRFGAITTFSDEGYRCYGQRFLRSFDARWPPEVTLHIYFENTKPNEISDRFVYHDLLAEVPELCSFKKRHQDNTSRTGHYEDGEYGYRIDAVRFAHKVLALTHCGLSLKNKPDVLFWIDIVTGDFNTPTKPEHSMG